MLDGLPLADLTAPALLGIAILLLLVGRLVPRTTYLDKVKEADNWHQAYEKEREARAAADAQTAQLLESVRTNHKIITAVFESIREMRGLGERSVVQKET